MKKNTLSLVASYFAVEFTFVLFFSCGNLSFADSSFGKTEEEMAEAGTPIRVVTPPAPSSSSRREIPEDELGFKECALPSHLICLPADCSTEGNAKKENFSVGRLVIGSWSKEGDSASWQVDIPEDGEYVVEMACTAPTAEGVRMSLVTGKGEKEFLLPQTCKGALFSQTIPIGAFALSKGKQNVTLRLKADAVKALWFDSLRIVPRKDWVAGVKMYPENFYRLNGLRLDNDKPMTPVLPVLNGSKSLANLICWRVDVPKTGNYRVEIDYSCATPGWKARLTLGIGAELVWDVPEMVRSENSWKTLVLGECSLNAGHIPVRISAEDKSNAALKFMDVYAIRLIPADQEKGEDIDATMK